MELTVKIRINSREQHLVVAPDSEKEIRQKVADELNGLCAEVEAEFDGIDIYYELT